MPPARPVATQSDALASAVALRALDYCRAAIGVPYQFGGTSRKTGYDCSGLVWAGYTAAGAPSTFPRTSEDQWGADFPKVAWGAWAPGDLVFSDWNDGQPSPGHVVIYAGNGWTIAAPERGTTVQFEHVSTFAPPHYVGSSRPYPLRAGQQPPPQRIQTPGMADYDPSLSGSANPASGGSPSSSGGAGVGVGALGSGVIILGGLLVLVAAGAFYLWYRGRSVQPDPSAPGGGV